MKIALIGTHGTGKTTAVLNLAAELKKKGVNVGIVEEVVRSCPFPINETATKKAQEWLFYKHYLTELEREEQYDVVLSDRSILDFYCYYYRIFGENKLMENFMLDKLKNYLILFKMPLKEEYLKEDNFRSVNKEFQLEIEEIMNRFIQRFNIPIKEFTSFEDATQKIIEVTQN